MNLSKRVIIFDKVKSRNIAQAIFILKDNADSEFSAVREAEKIVSEYLSDNMAFSKRDYRFPIVIGLLSVLSVVLILIGLIQ